MKRLGIGLLWLLALPVHAAGVDQLVGALLGDTSIVDDRQELTDKIGGRPADMAANREAVAWAVRTIREAEVGVRGRHD